MAAQKEDIHKHLEFIQLTITRMGANSFLVKGWAVTLVAAVLAFTAEKDKITSGAWIGLLPAAMFWGLDAIYLRQERLFRKLYDAARTGSVTDFCMDTQPFQEKVPRWAATLRAPTLLPFYVVLVGVVFAVATVDLAKDAKSPGGPGLAGGALRIGRGSDPAQSKTMGRADEAEIGPPVK